MRFARLRIEPRRLSGADLVVIALFAFLCFSSCSFHASSHDGSFDYPSFYLSHHESTLQDYRLPQGSDLSHWGEDVNSFFYKTVDDEGRRKEPYWTKGDFNGDGTIDVVYLLFHESSDQVLAFSFVSLDSRTYGVFRVSNSTKTMGLTTDKIARGGRATDVIRLFEFEGHTNHCRMWDRELNEFSDC